MEAKASEKQEPKEKPDKESSSDSLLSNKALSEYITKKPKFQYSTENEKLTQRKAERGYYSKDFKGRRDYAQDNSVRPPLNKNKKF